MIEVVATVNAVAWQYGKIPAWQERDLEKRQHFTNQNACKSIKQRQNTVIFNF
ncbi:hypothetical protein [Chromobacterium violaceum]|uniref:hypothetical protein n=1 Tax=Chromobacterium violaceum TaxID=536 RepID=UPI000B07239F|nr:hypothetical protein [Chromobacterium violaceum]